MHVLHDTSWIAGILECELTEWSVSVGDAVEEFQQVCAVASDKANVEITSRFAGIVEKLHHQPGDMVQVGYKSESSTLKLLQ